MMKQRTKTVMAGMGFVSQDILCPKLCGDYMNIIGLTYFYVVMRAEQ